jgi:hypothetical protein
MFIHYSEVDMCYETKLNQLMGYFLVFELGLFLIVVRLIFGAFEDCSNQGQYQYFGDI